MHLSSAQVYLAAKSVTNLFVSSYAGNITTLSLTNDNGSCALAKTFAHAGCAPSPSWLPIDAARRTLYCLDEGLDVANGSLSSYDIDTDGSLTQIQRAPTISGPVYGVIYGDPAIKRAIALAHYTGSAVSSWTLNDTDTGGFTFNQNIRLTLDHPGPDPSRQGAPHEHQAILDPTGRYILVPDLGADLVRVFSFDPNTGTLMPCTPLNVAPGSGPRHAVFYQPDKGTDEGATFLYVVMELGSTVTGYAVTYLADGGMAFEEVSTSSVFVNSPLPEGSQPAGIVISPDNRFLIISNRNDTSFTLPNPDPSNSTKILLDSFSTFALQPNGSLTFHQLWPCGGSYPRQFSLNKAGDLVAVGLQHSAEVIVFARDVSSGLIGKPVATVAVEGEVTCVQWDE